MDTIEYWPARVLFGHTKMALVAQNDDGTFVLHAVPLIGVN